jgi:N4-gp56 family major capsid protein
MGLGTNHVTRTTAATFIPAIWSDEIAAAYKKSLVVANIVKKMNFKGKKGDTIHIPVPTRGAASLKAASTQVTLLAATETEKTVSITRHFEYSRLIEDIVEAQALTSLRSFYTDDAGYSLAKQIDTDLIQLGRGANGGTAASARYTAAYIGSDGTTAYDYSANTNTGNAAALTDAAIRRTIQRLDDSDIPMDGRFFVIPPSSRNTLMGLARYTEQAFVGEAGGSNTIRNGEIGNLYGIPVFVSSNADSTSATAAFGTDSPSGTATGRVCLMGHRDAFILVEQMGVRSQTQYKQEYLGTLFTADTLYGVSELRDYGAIALAVPS